MAITDLLRTLGDEIEDAYEEAFLLFSEPIPSQNLGFIDSKATSLEITVGNRDLVIQQSPSLLSSDRTGGSTGAVVWKITPLFAEWITSQGNVLAQTLTITPNSIVLELGCGVSGVLALTLAPGIRKYIATDQEYVFKPLRQNIEDNARPSLKSRGNSKPVTKKKAVAQPTSSTSSNITTLTLDWETSDLTNLPSLIASSICSPNIEPFIDVVLACDCIYNENLTEPFVRSCAELCRSHASHLCRSNRDGKATICVVAQQLRSHMVFEAWLTASMRAFRVWRVKDELLTEGLRGRNGFVVHVGILKGEGVGKGQD